MIPWMDFPSLLILFQWLMICSMNYLGDLLAVFFEAEGRFVTSIWLLSHIKWFQIRFFTFQASFPARWEVLYSFSTFLSRLIRILKMLWASLAARVNLNQSTLSSFNDWDNPLEPHPFMTFLTIYLVLAVLVE